MLLHFTIFKHKSPSLLPILVLPGYMCHIDESYKSFCKSLGDWFLSDVYAIDLRNHGESPHTENQDIISMANDVLTVMDHCDLPVVTIYGHSFGGKLAQLLCLLYPSRIHTIIVEDMAICKDMRGIMPFMTGIVSTMLDLEREGIESISFADSKLTEVIPDKLRRDNYTRDLRKRENGKFHWRMNLKVLLASLEELLESIDLNKKDKFGSLCAFDRPILVLAGEESSMFFGQDNREEAKLQELFPKMEFVKVEKTGHFIRETRGELVFENVVRFLTQNK